jgi:hypothetical protein
LKQNASSMVRWVVFSILALLGLMALAAPAAGGGLPQDPEPTLPPAMWMTPMSGESVPGVGGPNYWVLGGLALLLLFVFGVVLVGAFFLLRKRRKPAPQAGAATATYPAAGHTQASAPAPGQATLPGYGLVVQSGPGTGARYPVGSGGVILGRAADCQVVINHPSISSHHARIDWDGQQFVAQDMGSTNGTFVNGYRLGGPVQFRPGDVLGLGGAVELVLQAG